MKKLTLFSLLTFIYTGAFTQAYSLDPTFNSTGFNTTNVGDSANYGRNVLLQPDGKIIVTGYAKTSIITFENFALVRYNTNGSRDYTFGGGGVVTDVTGLVDKAYASVLQSDGKIILGGEAGSDFGLVRYNTDGSLDNSFGTSGKVRQSLGGWSDAIYSLALQSDGKIIAGGVSDIGVLNFCVARFDASGNLDLSFGSFGSTSTILGTGSSAIFAIALQADDKIVAAGFSNPGSNRDITVARYTTDGQLDNTFGTNGIVTTAIGSGNEQALSVQIQSDGKIVVIGRSNNGSNDDFCVVRYNDDGSLDNSFNSTGIVTTSIGSGNDWGYASVLQPDGKIVAGGYTTVGSSKDFVLVRYNTDGSLDNGFSAGGIITSSLSTGDDGIYDLAIQLDGKILAAGYSYDPNVTQSYKFAIARYSNVAVNVMPTQQENSPFYAFPNPCSDMLMLTGLLTPGKIALHNVLGELMFEKNTQSSQIELDLSALSPGIYFLQYTQENQTQITRLVKE